MIKLLTLLIVITFTNISMAAKLNCLGSGDELYLFEAEVKNSGLVIENYSLELDEASTANPVAFGEQATADKSYSPRSLAYKNYNRFYLDTEIDGQYRILLPKVLSEKFTAYLRLNYGPEDDFFKFELDCEYN